MTSSDIQDGATARASAGRRPDGFVLILVLSFALSAMVILGWAWRSGIDHIFSAPSGASLFPGFTAEQGSGAVHGLVVTSLRSGSEAAKDGMEVGDAILAIDGHAIDTLDQARRYLHDDHQPALSLDLVHQKQLRHLRLMRSASGENGAQAAAGGG
ncbi:PDZ domain-containing protein [Sphingomonas sp. HITSZ_GF]|uniref:PDZ domain-containing protein n=1 Tax=Sphingomonas sp. HITSZ_GF TaxID=3037247 RepID=UPI00240D0060|nr:PDZ domain-containing protein [Sphingomonas sp. HITSZ_GF]MDG2534111.1 PDZ domain-containing protein [Sphingomonas sp. HITSZ_GF]